MGLIIKKLRVYGDKGEKRLEVLFDTGASASFVRAGVVSELATVVKLPAPQVFALGDGVGRLRVSQAALLYVVIKGLHISDEFIVAPHLADDVILGARTMQKWRIKLDVEEEDVLIDRRVARLLLA